MLQQCINQQALRLLSQHLACMQRPGLEHVDLFRWRQQRFLVDVCAKERDAELPFHAAQLVVCMAVPSACARSGMTKYDIRQVAFLVMHAASAVQTCYLGAYVCTPGCTAFVTNITRNNPCDCKKQLVLLPCGEKPVRPTLLG